MLRAAAELLARDLTTQHFAQQHVRVLSGLYGLLRPLDLLQGLVRDVLEQLAA